jgi:hypothetical protein
MALRTADGRDVSEDEWRQIPGFTRYKINASGDIIGPRGWLLKECYNKVTDTYFYNVNRDVGGKTARSFQSLLDLAFPELAEPKKPKPVPYIKRVGWRDIPGFPKHQLHESGEVRYKNGKRRVWPLIDVGTGEKFYRLVNKIGQPTQTQEWLLGRTFPELKEVA